MNDTTNDFATYLTPGERVIWRGYNLKTRRSSLFRSMGPVLLGLILALAIAYYIVFVLSPGSVLNIGLGIDTKASIFLIVFLVFGPFLIRPLWQGRKLKSVSLFGVELPLIEIVLITAGVMLLVIVLLKGMAISLLLLVIWPALMVIIVESQQEQNVEYLVTNLSGLIVPTAASRGKRVTIIPFGNLTQIQVVENRDGTGSLLFGTQANVMHGARTNSAFAFWNIEKPWEVYQLIRKQMADLKML